MIFDAHVHLIDPRFPLVGNQGYLPPPYVIDDYRRDTAALGVDGGAIVSGSFQGTHSAYLAAALGELGPGWVGVVQLDRDADAATIRRLDRLGVQGLPHLLELVAHGAWVKATGFGRLAFDVAGAQRAIAAENPGALVFGKDLPGTRAPRRFALADLDLLHEALGPDRARRATWDNARALYRFTDPTPARPAGVPRPRSAASRSGRS